MSLVFIDTSAILALLSTSDLAHERAVAAFDRLHGARTRLVTTSYVLVETYALIRSRLGVDAMSDFRSSFAPLLDVVWIDEELHERALDDLARRPSRKLSLVDVVSFQVIRMKRIEHVFAFDRHFEAEGFSLL